MKMKVVPVAEAVGMALPHDMTRIVPGEFKGRAFRKGHIIRSEDVDILLSMGKEHIGVLDLGLGMVHEDDAAGRIARAAAGPGLALTQVCEGRINFIAERSGLFKIDLDLLRRVNSVSHVVLATLHSNRFVGKGLPVAGTRVVPLVVEEAIIAEVERLCAGKTLLEIKPLRPARVGLIITGGEVYHGRIKDKFGPVVRRKFAELGSEVVAQALVSDSMDMTKAAIEEMLAAGADMIVCTGGMSVDPDDLTPASIRAAGATIDVYGAPVFPGAMFLIGHIGEVPILGLPGCVMYHRASVFDLLVPRLLAGERVGREDVVSLAHGGFCASCPECRFPVCPFGKGS